MGLAGYYSIVGLCFLISIAESYNPWDFSAVRPPGHVLPARQPLGPPRPEFNGWAWVDASQPRALSPLMPVTVQCGEAQVLVTVDQDLFGTGRLIQAADLSLGEAGCKHTSLEAAENVVVFAVGLHECGSILKVTPDSLVYTISLYYKPTPGNNPLIIRTNSAEVPIECHYPRKDNVSSEAIQPTWVPFSSTISAEHKLAFSLRLMNDDWSAERATNSYYLGDVLQIQADVNTENQVALRLFIDSCVATLSPDRDSTPQYAIIDHKGCLVDGRSEDANSAFIAPRPKQDSLRFTVDVFRFAGDPRDLIYITCHLKVTAADQAPDASNKACSFSKASNVWSPVEGPRDICSCCETRNCESVVDQSRRRRPSWRAPGRLGKRDVTSLDGDSLKVEAEADVVVGPLFIPDGPMASQNLQEGETEGNVTVYGNSGVTQTGMMVLLWVSVAAAVVALASVVLSFLLVCKTSHHFVWCNEK